MKTKNAVKPSKKIPVNISTTPITEGKLTYYRFFYLSLISLILLIDVLFQAGATNIFISRAWGLNNFAYFSWWVQIFIFSILYALTIPSVNSRFRLFVQKLTVNIPEKINKENGKILWFIGISSFITLLFYLFRVKYDFLGDMDLRVTQSVNKQYVNDEYFTMYLLHYLSIFLHSILNTTPHQAFVFHSLACGFLYCFLTLLIGDLLFDNMRSIIVFFLFCISIGTVLVLCGYVEIYAIPVASVALYVYASVLFLKNKTTIFLPFLCLVLAIVLHLEQVSLLPSFVFIAIQKFKFSNLMGLKGIVFLFIISIPVIYLLNSLLHLNAPITSLIATPPPDSHAAYPLKYPTLFSIAHLWVYITNSQYISSGVYFFLCIFILINIFKRKFKEDVYSLFFLTMVLFSFSIVFTANKERGSGDWDICSFPAISIAMFVAYVVLTKWKKIYSPEKTFYITSIALVLNTFSCWAWIGINSSEKSETKIKDMLFTASDPIYYPKEGYPTEFELAFFYEKHGSHDSAMHYFKVSYEKYNGTIYSVMTNYVFKLLQDKDTNNAMPILEKSITEYPYLYTPYQLLIVIYENRKEYDKVYAISKLYLAKYETNPDEILGDADGRSFLIRRIKYLYQASLTNNDTIIHNEVLKAMEELNSKNY